MQHLSGIEKFIVDQVSHYGFISQDASLLHKAIMAVEYFRNMDEHQLKTIIVNAFNIVNKSNMHDGVVDIAGTKTVGIEHIRQADNLVKERAGIMRTPERDGLGAGLGKSEAKSYETGHKKPGTHILNNASQFASASREQKIMAAASMACAALSAVGAFKSASNSMMKDENGKSHVQWTNVSAALLQSFLAAAFSYIGVRELRFGTLR